MSDSDPDAMMYFSDVEDYGEQTPTHEANQDATVNRAIKSSQAPVNQNNASRVTKIRARKMLASKFNQKQKHALRAKAGEIMQKLRNKTTVERAESYENAKDNPLRSIIVEVQYKKHMAVLDDWERQIEGKDAGED